MTAKSSRTIPFIAMGIAVMAIILPTINPGYCVHLSAHGEVPDCEVVISGDLIIYILGIFGLAGPAKSAVGKAAAIRRQIPPSIEEEVQRRLKEALDKTGGKA